MLKLPCSRPLFLALILSAYLFFGIQYVVAAESYSIVHDNSSDYCIHYDATESTSVKQAARDLQKYLHQASGVRLNVVNRKDVICHAYIYLGASHAAASVGISDDGLPYESFRLKTQDGNFYIVGNDSADGALTLHGGTSHGTRNGVYTFLEDYVGIRWLMPGEVGEEVPVHSEIVIPELDHFEAPGFENRRIPYIQNDNPLVQEWLQHQKQGFSLQLNHYHNFRHLIPAGLYDEHPDWFPLIDGTRPRPSGRYKLETTNPELVNEVAQQVSEALKQTPSLYSYSISPSDSGGWSSSPESLALYDRDPHGKVSITPLVLDFYRNVAEKVGNEFNDHVLCGYIYTNYLYPPSKGVPELPDNLCLVLAPDISYGYGLYREATRQDLEHLLRQWKGVTPQIAYYDLPVNLLQSVGAPNPPGLEILSYLYPRIAGAGMRGVYMYGVSAWGQGALTNYLLAKLNWNPKASVQVLAREFFQSAYGQDAGPVMQELYSLLDENNKKFHQHNETAGFRLTPALLKAVYVPVLGEMQSLFNKAQQLAKTTKQHQRLWMFQRNMQRFVAYLQAAGLADSSELRLFSEQSVNKQRISNQYSGVELALAPLSDGDQEPAYKLRMRILRDEVKNFFHDLLSGYKPTEQSSKRVDKSKERAVQSISLRGGAHMALYPHKNMDAEINFTRVVDFGELVRFRFYDADGELLRQGLVSTNKPLHISLQGQRVYQLEIISGQAILQMHVSGPALAVSTQSDKQGLHLSGMIGEWTFLVPKKVSVLSLSLHTESLQENAAVDIYSSSGRKVASLDTSGTLSSRTEIHVKGEWGAWRIVGKASRSGVVDDVWLKLDERVTQWVAHGV